MGEQTQLNVRIPAELHARLDDILDRLRAALGLPMLSRNDLVGMGIDLVAQWLDAQERHRDAILGEVRPEPQEPPEVPRRGRGRPRKSPPGGEGGAA